MKRLTASGGSRPWPPTRFLIQRPLITLDDGTAVVGRSPDSVLVCSAIGVCIDPLIRRLDAAQRGTFEVTIVASGDQTRAAVLDREAYGALVITPEGAQMIIASAASSASAQLLGRVAKRCWGLAMK